MNLTYHATCVYLVRWFRYWNPERMRRKPTKTARGSCKEYISMVKDINHLKFKIYSVTLFSFLFLFSSLHIFFFPPLLFPFLFYDWCKIKSIQALHSTPTMLIDNCLRCRLPFCDHNMHDNSELCCRKPKQKKNSSVRLSSKGTNKL